MRYLGGALIMAALALGTTGAWARVVTYPAPAGETLSGDYEVWADGQKVDVYTARTLDPPFAGKQWDYGGPYSFCNFDTSGPVKVKIVSKTKALRDAVVRPERLGIKPAAVDDHTITLALDGPRKVSVEPEGKRGPLLLFANPIETDVPKQGDANVVYFGPGVHKPDKIILTSGQTLYLAGGAVVHGAVVADGDNIRICGRGILDGSDWPWLKGPAGQCLGIHGDNVEVNGITIRGSFAWTIVPRSSRHVTIRNVKICGGRVQNDDGMNPCNSQDVLITDCFIRSDDDCVAMKGLDLNAPNNNVERVTVENSTLWCDRARIFLLGHESRAAFMRQVALRNLDIIHYTMTPFLFEPGEEMRLEDVTVQDVRVHGEGQHELLRLLPVVNQYMRNKVPGHIARITFRNVAVEGKPGEYLLQVAGADPAHAAKDITFENVTVLGEKVTDASKCVKVGGNTEGIRFR